MKPRHTGWLDHTEYLQERTPLTERQADVLALWKTGESFDEISDTLGLPVARVEDHWSDILDQLDRAQEFCTIMGPHPWGDGETRETDDVDDTTWNLMASAAMNYSDEARTRLELELYHGYSGQWNETYLLVEREIENTEDYATETTETRGAHGSDGLRDYIYHSADTLDEYYLRYMLLEKSGIDPSAEHATPPEAVLKREISQKETDAARKRARDRVDRPPIQQA